MINSTFGKLNRVIVGIMDHATIPYPHYPTVPSIPNEYRGFFADHAGESFPDWLLEKATEELDGFVAFLENRGVCVDRPKPVDYSQPIVTDDWSIVSGLFAAMPRDILLQIGKKIIVAPMCWRSRYREIESYIDLLIVYERELGYEIVNLPRPKLGNESFFSESEINMDPQEFHAVLTEYEPLFDAADFFTLDDVVLGQESLVTNKSGVELVRSLCGSDHGFVPMKFNDPRAMHIDATFLPIAEGLIIANTHYVDVDDARAQLPEPYASWDIMLGPEPVIFSDDPPKYFTSDWLHINMLNIGNNTVVVEEKQEPLIVMLEKWGLTVCALPFNHFQSFAGSFHCATLEVERE